METLFAAILKTYGVPAAMMGAAVLWFNNQVNKRDSDIKRKDEEKDALHAEMRAILEDAHKRSTETIVNNTLAMQSLKDMVSDVKDTLRSGK